MIFDIWMNIFKTARTMYIYSYILCHAHPITTLKQQATNNSANGT